ncbi:MAG: patatin-like phospholipase family protein, partial [Gemmatimonadetes bacterium]|nr:patatin-like phospholipase family protein [Gemmatimonadota bacterium]
MRQLTPVEDAENPEYPAALRGRERSLAKPERRGKVGLACSGGGIRSATFCLGFFQGLAQHGLLRHVDYLSTVSGGGYFGSFLGRLFCRDNPSQRPEEVLKDSQSSPIRFLRE